MGTTLYARSTPERLLNTPVGPRDSELDLSTEFTDHPHPHHRLERIMTTNMFASHAVFEGAGDRQTTKAHRWDAAECVSGGPDMQNPQSPHFYETCRVVFIAPEMAPPHQATGTVPRRRSKSRCRDRCVYVSHDLQSQQKFRRTGRTQLSKFGEPRESLVDAGRCNIS